MTIKNLVEYGAKELKQANIDEAFLKVKLLLAYLLNKPKEYIIIHSDENVSEKLVNEFNIFLKELKNNTPLAYITHNQEFMKLNFYVDENVLIPRADTEILVEEVIKKLDKPTQGDSLPAEGMSPLGSYLNMSDEGEPKGTLLLRKVYPHLAHASRKSKILDLCTGSGAIAVSLAKYIPESNVFASDISKNSLEIAKRNAKGNGVQISFTLSNLFDNIEEKNFDVIASNPPYIETDIINTLQKEVQKEPRIALDGGSDGLDFYRKIILTAPKHLKTGGLLALEIGYNQAEAVVNLIKENKGYGNIEVIKDLAGNNRVIMCNLI